MFSNKEAGILVIAENTCLMNNVLAQHGVSFLLSYYGKKYLFDCAQIFKGLNHNLKEFNINPNNIDGVIISHDHYDHCHALPEFIKEYNPSKIYVPEDFKSLESPNIIKTKGVEEIEKGFYIIGLGSDDNIKEQSAVIDFGKEGIIIIVGCSHPGLKNIIEESQKITGNNKIMGVIGGFHLFESKEKEIQEIIDYLKTLDLGFLIPGHCTGINAIHMMREQLNDKLKISHMGSIGVGNSIKFMPEIDIKIDEW